MPVPVRDLNFPVQVYRVLSLHETVRFVTLFQITVPNRNELSESFFFISPSYVLLLWFICLSVPLAVLLFFVRATCLSVHGKNVFKVTENEVLRT
jgi:hypothetical protein